MRVSIIGAIAVILIGGCTSGPRRVDYTNPTVTYEYYGDPYGPQLAEVRDQATVHCDNFGRFAELQDVDRRNDRNYATFECV